MICFLLACGAVARATNLTYSGTAVSPSLVTTYTHLVNQCNGPNNFVQYNCIESVSPTSGSPLSLNLPSVNLTQISPNATFQNASLYLFLSTVSSSDVQNSWSSNGSVSGSTNYPQGSYVTVTLTSVTFGGNTYSASGTFVNLLSLGLGNILQNGGAISATGSANNVIYAFDGWTGTPNFTFTQNRTLTRTSNYYLYVSTDFTEPPGVPEPSTALLSIPILAYVFLRHSRRHRGNQ